MFSGVYLRSDQMAQVNVRWNDLLAMVFSFIKIIFQIAIIIFVRANHN